LFFRDVVALAAGIVQLEHSDAMPLLAGAPPTVRGRYIDSLRDARGLAGTACCGTTTEATEAETPIRRFIPHTRDGAEWAFPGSRTSRKPVSL